jgi:dimethyl sulfoxide reductase membrane subunit
MTMTIPNEHATRRYQICLAVTAFLMLLGFVAWLYELRYGLGSTGMRGVISWGFYIFSFAFFVKLSAGGLIVASSAEVFGIVSLKPLARLGVLTAAACIAVAAITIIPDLGRPDRAVNLFLHPNWRSPMIWDAAVVGLYLLLAVIELRLMFASPATEKRARQLRVLAFVGLPAAFALHSITAWIFGLQISRAFWNTALMAPLFVVSAILSGTALITIIAGLLQKFAGIKLEEATWRNLGGLMAISLAIDIFFLICEYLTVLWAKVPSEMVALKMILPGGQFASLFWLEWVLGGAVPFLLLVLPRTRRRVGAMVGSAALILTGVYAFQIELTTVGMANPLIQLAPGNSLGTYIPGQSVFQFVGQYAPTWVEYFIALGLVAFGAMLVTIGWRYLGFEELRSEPAEMQKGATA